jgi:hypothetical protein
MRDNPIKPIVNDANMKIICYDSNPVGFPLF